jgi:hypothetical protein
LIKTTVRICDKATLFFSRRKFSTVLDCRYFQLASGQNFITSSFWFPVAITIFMHQFKPLLCLASFSMSYENTFLSIPHFIFSVSRTKNKNKNEKQHAGKEDRTGSLTHKICFNPGQHTLLYKQSAHEKVLCFQVYKHNKNRHQ